jgi:hypothetical protein
MRPVVSCVRALDQAQRPAGPVVDVGVVIGNTDGQRCWAAARDMADCEEVLRKRTDEGQWGRPLCLNESRCSSGRVEFERLTYNLARLGN